MSDFWQVREEALRERDVLTQQALLTHESNVQCEMGRFRQELAHIAQTYELRLSAIPESETPPS